LFSYFLELHGTRGASMAGPLRITFAEIEAWQRVQGMLLEPWQIDAITGADRAYIASVAKGKPDA
jgi:hypothetical protein